MQDTEDRSVVSRRTVVAGAAWAVPAVVAASAMPAYAASTTKTTVKVVSAAGTTPVITFGLSTNETYLLKDTIATFEVSLAPSNLGNQIDPTPNTSTGLVVSDPTTGKGDRTFTVTVTVTAGTVSSPSEAATLTLTGWPGGTYSAKAIGVTVPSGQIEVNPTPKP